MTKTPARFWHDMTTRDFMDNDTGEWIAILPIAAIEQHGPHLPLSTDTAIAEGYISATLEKLPDSLPATFLPTQAIGKSDEHISYSGTLTLSWETLTKAWLEIGDCVARSGIRKLVLINSHGGNVPIMDIVARELRIRHKMLVATTNWLRFGQPKGLFTEHELSYGIHGGDIETSLMLYLRPDLVKMELAEDFRSRQLDFIQDYKYLRAHGRQQFGWKTEDLGPSGALGNATLASAEKGRLSIEYASEAFIEFLKEIQFFDTNNLN